MVPRRCSVQSLAHKEPSGSLGCLLVAGRGRRACVRILVWISPWLCSKWQPGRPCLELPFLSTEKGRVDIISGNGAGGPLQVEVRRVFPAGTRWQPVEALAPPPGGVCPQPPGRLGPLLWARRGVTWGSSVASVGGGHIWVPQ